MKRGDNHSVKGVPQVLGLGTILLFGSCFTANSFIWVSGERGQTLSSGAQRQDKGQRAQTEAWEAPAEPEEELLPSEGDGALAQAAQGGGGVSPSLEIFKTRLDKVLYSLL